MTNILNPTAAAASDPVVKGMLREGETLICVAGIHPGIYWKSIAVGALSIILLIKAFNLGLFITFVALLSFSYAYLLKHYLRFVLTDKRVLIRQGIINLDTVQLHLDKVESVETARTIIGRILGYSAVLITGTGSRVTVVPYIANAEEMRVALDKLIFARDEAKK